MSTNNLRCRDCGRAMFSCACRDPRQTASDLDSDDSRAELQARLVRQASAVHRIEIEWYVPDVVDTAMRMKVALKDRAGCQIDQWEDWMIVRSNNRPDVVALDRVIEAVFGQDAIQSRSEGLLRRFYTLR